MLELTRDGAIATLTLRRPEVRNAFNAALIAALCEVCAEVSRDRSVRVLVLRGEGVAFCAGADLHWMQASMAFSHEENLEDAGQLDAMFAALNELPQAVIGCVHGATLGGGIGLVACCDMVIASETASFGFTEARLGLLPAVIARYVVPKIGPGHARALFTSAQRFSAQHALAIGLVHEIVPEAELETAVVRALEAYMLCGPQAVAEAKALIAAVSTLPPIEARDYVVGAIAAARTSAEGQEGLRAFLEKRRPAWSTLP
ncbi:enoyl-CoA hydratase-related protein [Candidatus Chloroploca asiatica]|uniref:Enoyl-CoA hydratase n=1 Tax=Candidatus Chloroploca asiatica TaxID=1506545 RepID=A0A2H3KHY1_9CHLR|nr:enoyl-CoA hydratase-related protein [Candidatus Chloroploca asiatica]PDV97393.1 enoyl-CoA hydratase [Candidatus Chloroploca asiatica]